MDKGEWLGYTCLTLKILIREIVLELNLEGDSWNCRKAQEGRKKNKYVAMNMYKTAEQEIICDYCLWVGSGEKLGYS